MTKKFVFRSNKYNVTHQDIQRGIETRGYIDENPNTSNQSNPLDKWYKYSALRSDENIFVSSSVNISSIQIHDAVARYYDYVTSGQIEVSAELGKIYSVGYNFSKQKFFNYVEEFLLQNPNRIFEFEKDPDQLLISLTDLYIKNILIYEGSEDETNTTLPLLKTNIGNIVGHHKDGRFEKGLQGPFTEHNVGGYKHRHQAIGSISDRPERFTLTDSGNTLTIKSPVSGNLNVPYSRFSRGGFTKSVVNIKNIRITNSNTLGNFAKNYQIVNGLHRRNQNMAFIDQPNNFTTTELDSPVVSGTSDYTKPDRRLLDGTYNKSVYVNKFNSPGEVRSTSPVFMDPNSEEYSVYSTTNYRNLIPRIILKSYLSLPSYFGGYVSGAFGTTASYQKTQRNNRYIPVSGTTNFRLREDNAYISYGIPARDGGYSWIKAYTTGGNNPGLYVNGIDNDINFITSAIDNLYFSPLSSSYLTITTSSMTLNPSETNVLRKFNVQFNGVWNYTTKKQLSQNYNPIVIKNKKQNYYVDNIYDPSVNSSDLTDVRVKDSFIKDKHTNIVTTYINESGSVEEISFPFGQNYSSMVSDVYRTEYNQNINLYSDQTNIKTADKSQSLFKKLLNFDKYVKQNNLKIGKIKNIKLTEKIYPRSQNVYRNIARVRNAYSQSWADSLDNRLTELTNSQGQVFVGGSNEINNYSGTKYKFSYWPMDAYSTTTPPEIPSYVGLRDKSGELMQLDNVSFYSTLLGYGSTNIVVPSGSYFGARFGRNNNSNRPANVVHEQAGRGPYCNSYEEYYSDIKLIGQDCSVIPEYRISPRLDEYYVNNLSYYDSTFNQLELTGTTIEDVTLAVSTSSAFLEQRVSSDYIDLNAYLNQELTDYKLNTIKLKVKGIKKFLPYDGFYPVQRMVKLANYFSSSYKDYFTFTGPSQTYRTVLTPFYAPGIGFNSVKAGVGMPFSVAIATSSNAATLITSSLDVAATYYQKLPWDAIIYPRKRLRELPSTGALNEIKFYDIDPDMPFRSEVTVATSVTGNYYYDYVANNFYSEVVNFFKDTSKLTSIKSRPSDQWYFPDLTKKYAMDIIINKEGEFYTYSSFQNFGPKPYAFHAPPWHYVGAGDATVAGINRDLSSPPNTVASTGYAYATIVFDPSSLAVGDLDYFVKGQFGIGDVLRNSTVSYGASIVNYNTSSATIQIGDVVDLFSVSSDGLTWQPKLKWECPTANLNFNGLSGKLTNSVGNDSGDSSVGSAIRGIWHQYAPIADDNQGLFLSVRNSNVNTSLTGSLLDVVGFDKSAREKIGEIAQSKIVSETLLIIPFYFDSCGEEKYFDIDIDLFERLYAENIGVVGEMKLVSRNYVLPPQIDFIKFRDNARKRLEKDQYGLVKSPFLVFPFEFSSVLNQQDLADIWQGVLPTSVNKAEIDYQEKEFFIGNYLKDLNFKLPDNTRFKVFKVKKRAVVNYEEINYKSLGFGYADTSYGYNWPYDFFSLLEMAEVKAELSYDTEIAEDITRFNVGSVEEQIQRAIEGRTVDLAATEIARTAEAARETTTTRTSDTTATREARTTDATTTRESTFDQAALIERRTLAAALAERADIASTIMRTELSQPAETATAIVTTTLEAATFTAPSSTSTLGGTGNTVTSTTTNTRS